MRVKRSRRRFRDIEEPWPDDNMRDPLRWLTYAQAIAVALCFLIAVADYNSWALFSVLKPTIVPLAICIPLFPIAALVAWALGKPRQGQMLLVVLVSVLMSILQLGALAMLYA